MHLALVRKDADLVRVHAQEYTAVLIVCCFFVSFIGIFVDQLHITKAVHQEANFCLFHLLLLVDSFLGILDGSTAFAAVFLLDAVQFPGDYCCHGVVIIQDILVFGNILHRLLIVCLKCLDLQSDQLIETHIQDRTCLLLCKFEL